MNFFDFLHDAVRRVTVLCFALVLAAALASGTVEAREGTRSGHVYLIKGFLGVFSSGLDDMAAALRRRGIGTTVDTHVAADALAEAEVRNFRSGNRRTIVLVGHSLGANAIFSMAERFAAAGIPVKLIVALDPISRTTAPPNVARVVNMYFGNGMGVASQRAARFRGALTNVDLSNRNDIGHFTMHQSPAMQRRVIDLVTAAVRSGYRAPGGRKKSSAR